MTRYTILALALVGCANTVPVAEEVERTSLAARLGENVDVTGLSLEPGTGALILASSSGRIWRVQGDEATILPGTQGLEEGWFGEVKAVAAMGNGRIAVTVPNIGLLLDENTGSLEEFFCYEPGSFGDWDVQEQQTNTLDFDVTTGNLVSQPVTLQRTGEQVEFLRADVAEFDGTQGGDLAWYPLEDNSFQSEGLAVREGIVTLLDDSKLYEVPYGSGQLDLIGSIEGIERAEDMVWDGDDLLVIDGATQELVRIRL